MTTASTQAERYIENRHLFRQQEIILPDGRSLGQAEEPWQSEHVFGPWTPRTATESFCTACCITNYLEVTPRALWGPQKP